MKDFWGEKHKDSYRIYDLCVYEKKNEAENERNALKVVFSPTTMDDFIKLSFKDAVTTPNSDTEHRSENPHIAYDAFGKEVICNDFCFESYMVLSMQKIFEYTEAATRFADDNPLNVIILQSTS